MKTREIAKTVGGRIISGPPEFEIDLADISIDSRAIKEGQFFLPLKGGNFNGEDFIEAAFKNGAIGTFTTRSQMSDIRHDKVVIRVKDAIDAMQKLAHYNRMRFKIPVIGITGSNGKTTVKDMTAKVLSQKYNVLKNE